MEINKKVIIAALQLLPLYLMVSCSEDTQNPGGVDSQKPSIVILSPTDITLPLRGIVLIKAEANDNSEIRKMEMSIDNVTIYSISSSSINFSWDSKTVDDGSHAVKIIAEDVNGNTEEVNFLIVTQNLLFHFTVAEGYLESSVKKWIFITDQMGKSSDVYPIINNGTISIPIPENQQPANSYMVTILNYSYRYDVNIDFFERNRILSTYAEVKPGKYLLKRKIIETKPPIGSHKLQVANYPVQFNDLGVFGSGLGNGIYIRDLGSTLEMETNMTKSVSDLTYYIVKNEDYRYFKANAAKPGEVAVVAYNDMVQMQVQQISFDEPVKSNYFVYGVTNKQYDNQVRLFHRGQSLSNIALSDKLSIHYSNENFDEYVTNIGSYGATKNDFYYSLGNSLPTTFKKWNGEVMAVEITNGEIVTQLSNDASILQVRYSKVQETSSESVSDIWYFYLPANSTYTHKFPQLPKSLPGEFQDISFDDIKFQTATVIDILNNENGFQSYVNYILNSEGQELYGGYLFTPNKEVVVYEQNLSASSGGRNRTK